MPTQSAMESMNLGPNGGLVYCMEYLLHNFEWLEERILSKMTSISLEKGSTALLSYVIFDCPGQVRSTRVSSPTHFLKKANWHCVCYLCKYIHTYVNTYIHMYIHTYIHIYTYIHTYTHTYT